MGTETEVILLDAGLRKEVFLALTMWDVVIDVVELPTRPARRDPSRHFKSKTSQTTPHRRHVSRTHRVGLDFFVKRPNQVGWVPWQ